MLADSGIRLIVAGAALSAGLIAIVGGLFAAATAMLREADDHHVSLDDDLDG